MDQLIRDRYSGQILKKVSQAYGLTELKPLNGFESFIYECRRDEEQVVLRITHTDRRTIAHIEAEVEWINYLAAHDVAVARALHSKNGRLIEQVEDQAGGYFLATLFIKALGGPPRSDLWNSELFEAWGKMIGRMHRVTKRFEPADLAKTRPHWDGVELIEMAQLEKIGTPLIVEKYDELVAHLRQLPKDIGSYGLIHQDAHAGNFFSTERYELTFFDFDDAAYSWFVNDIAIILFYAASGPKEKVEFGQQFMIDFMRGYWKEHQLKSGWWQDIPAFLKLREFQLYGVIHRSIDISNMPPNSWIGWFMDGRQELLENERPFFDLDFSFLAEFNERHS